MRSTRSPSFPAAREPARSRSTRRLGIRFAAATLSGSLVLLLLPTVAPAAFKEFPLSISPVEIAAGPHRTLWFTEATCVQALGCRGAAHRIGKITTGGAVTQYSAGISGTPFHITAGPDGNMWFTEALGLSIGTNAADIAKITPGGLVTQYKVTQKRIRETQNETTLGAGITAGPDGNLWFTGTVVECTTTGTPPLPPPAPPPPPTATPPPPPTATPADVSEYCGQHRRIGKITPSGAVTEYAGPEVFATSITPGPDGKLWFTQGGGPAQQEGLAKITIGGAVTEYSRGGFPKRRAIDITAGPDGNLWFTENLANRIAKITPAGVVTEYSVGRKLIEPADIAAGPDGNLWFNGKNIGRRIGRITTSGKVTYYSTPGTPGDITAGPDGNLWFTEQNPNRIVRFSLPIKRVERK